MAALALALYVLYLALAVGGRTALQLSEKKPSTACRDGCWNSA